MIIKIGNVLSQFVIGGKDNLLKIDLSTVLREYLREKVPNAYRVKAYRIKKWDGYKYFINKNMEFPTGLLPALSSYLVELGVEVTIVDLRTNLPGFKHNFIEAIGDWTLRDYQADCVKKANNRISVVGNDLYFPRGMYDCATNAGKTSIIAGIYNNLVAPDALLLIHSKDIYTQLVKYFSKMYDVGEIRSGVFRPTKFTVGMAKTVGNMAESSLNVKMYLNKINTLFVDETHRAGGTEYSWTLKEIGAGARYLVSGTPLDSPDKIAKLMLIGLSGKVLGKITNKYLIEEGHSRMPVIHIKENAVWEVGDSLGYAQEVENCIYRSNTRLQDTIDFITEREGQKILIVFSEIEHGEYYYNVLSELFKGVEFVHGKDKQRASKLADFDSGKTTILIASTIVQEGLNIVGIMAIILLIAGKSKIRVKQFLGRGTREHGDSLSFDVLDWYDHGKYIAAHSRKRISVYKEEGFVLKFHYKENRWGSPVKKLS